MVWECACARSFKSPDALRQHLDAKGCVVALEPEDPPAGASYEDGEWIPFVDGNKRLGHYECPECSNVWMSGNSYLESWQACRECETDVFPEWRWRRFARTSAAKPKQLAHHDATRCQRCLEGNPCVSHPR